MHTWLSLVVVLAWQEAISTTAVLSVAYQEHIAPWSIHLLWLLIVSLETLLGYVLGNWVRAHLKNPRVLKVITRFTTLFEKYVGRFGERLTLMCVAFLVSPGVAAFIASWLGISLTSSFFLIMLSDLIWYTLEWIAVIGVTSITTSVGGMVLIILIAGIVISILTHIAYKRL